MMVRIAAARPLLLFDLAMKTALVGLLVVALLWPHLPQFEGEHVVWRALTYPLSVLVVPAVWAIFGRTRAETYPYGLDLLLPLPLLLDAAAPRLYHSVDWWDKFMHVASWSVLGAASVLLLSRFRLDHAVVAGLAVGIGLLTAVLWELGEYLVWVRHSPDLVKTEYTDTLGDLTCGLTGSVLAVALTLLLTTRRERAKLKGHTTVDSVESSPGELVAM